MSPGRRRSPPWLTRNLVILTLVSFSQDAASELMYPLLPILLTGVLAAPPVVLGVVEGVADATAGVTRYVSGRWSDRRGRRPFIGAGYSLAAVGKILVAAAVTWPLVLAGRVVDRFGKGVRSAPRDALIAASVPAAARGRAFGFHRAGDSAGAVVGPLLGLAALAVLDDDVHAALWWAVVPATLSALLVVFVREPRVASASPSDEPSDDPPSDRSGDPSGDRPCDPPGDPPGEVPVGRSPLPRRFWMVTLGLVAFALVNFSDALLLLRLVDLGLSTTEVVLAYVLFNAVYTAASYPAGHLSDHWPHPFVYAVGLAAFAVGYLGLAAVDPDGGGAVYLVVAVYGLFPAFTDGVGKAWIASLVPARHLGRAQGVHQGLTSVAMLVAGLWAGLSWRVGPGDGVVPLVVAGIGGLVGAVLLTAAAAGGGARSLQVAR